MPATVQGLAQQPEMPSSRASLKSAAAVRRSSNKLLKTSHDGASAPMKPRRPTLLAPLPPRLLQAWQAELTGTGVDARAHWWAMPHWVPRRKLTGAAPSCHELLADTVRHICGELDASFGGVEMWVQKRAASAAMHLHWDMDEERVRCAAAS